MKGMAASLPGWVCTTTAESVPNYSGSNQWALVWYLSLHPPCFLVAPSIKGPSSSGRRNKMRAGNLVSNPLLNYWFGRYGWGARLKSLIRKHYPYLIPWPWKSGSYAFTLKGFPQMVYRWLLKMISSKIIWIFISFIGFYFKERLHI